MRQFTNASGSRQVPRHATSLKLVLTSTVCLAIAPAISRALRNHMNEVHGRL